ncbi:hypothetical protein [Stakelama tenebrarum]|uniref:SH3 domain-containing protein n=1 Tax=Stakelama tenebrarum TaxID=2711215 RepID=A0A6G6Y1L3_9SPHN|nr:hypothetical protein [Sphingosinithalassobacter tenebrarum]QIG78815.1 hypothetical protein G5C33_02750 [Sphingosinithalassobacter tenebrarum]
MMRILLTTAAALTTAMALPAAAQEALPGVSDEETTISFAADGGIRQIVKGHGDVLFLRDRTERWYRVETSHGCLDQYRESMTTIVDTGINNRFDRNSMLRIPQLAISCGVTSIRASEAPPQVDSDSVVTLD